MNNGFRCDKFRCMGNIITSHLMGGIIVIVTMMKAVSERTREIGVLRAIGWTQRRILGMIMGESLVLSLIGSCCWFALSCGNS